MTKEEVLQRANDYCSERSYDSETLTDEFKDKFADFFAKRHESAGIDDDGIMDEIKFNLDTAKSAASRGIASKQTSFSTKESELNRQIEELKKKIVNPQPKPTPQQKVELPEDVKKQLEELEKFKNEQSKNEKFKSVVALAKKSIRQDLHASFDEFVDGSEVKLDKDDKEQAEALVQKFQKIFRDSIGDIKPLAPRQIQQRDEDLLASVKEVKVC